MFHDLFAVPAPAEVRMDCQHGDVQVREVVGVLGVFPAEVQGAEPDRVPIRVAAKSDEAGAERRAVGEAVAKKIENLGDEERLGREGPSEERGVVRVAGVEPLRDEGEGRRHARLAERLGGPPPPQACRVSQGRWAKRSWPTATASAR